MAKSAKIPSKKSSSVKKAIKKAAVKRTVSKNKSTVKKSSPAKTPVKKSVTGKAAGKISSKKAAIKKPVGKKAANKKKPVPAIATKKLVVKNRAGNNSTKAKIKETILQDSALDQKTAAANNYSEMIESNGRIVEANPSDGDNKPSTAMHTIPAPQQKYGRPADPYHGRTAPVKGKSNIAPSGKKPLWNK